MSSFTQIGVTVIARLWKILPVVLLIGVITLAAPPPTTQAQSNNVKLSTPTTVDGLILRALFLVTPDGSRVVYLDQEQTDAIEIFSAPTDGSATPQKLNGALTENGSVSSIFFAISADSTTVIYRADQDTDGINELYSAPIVGGTTNKLNAPLVSGGNVSQVGFQISPDSNNVVYLADQDIDETNELYSVPLAGSTVTKLNTPFVGGEQIRTFKLSPDGTTVVYTADQDTNGIVELYSVPIGGGTVTKLNAPLVGGGQVSEDESLSNVYEISPDSTTVVYRADQDTDGIIELYSVPIGGGTVTKLNPPLVNGGNVDSNLFQISPDSSTVVYNADQDANTVFELYSVPIGGGTVTKLNPPLVGDESAGVFQISPTGNTVVYAADQDTEGTIEIYSVPIGGGTPQKLNGSLVSGGNVSLTYEITADSSRVIYDADQDTTGVTELYSVSIDPPLPTSPFDVDKNLRITPTDATYVINRLGQTVTTGNATADVNDDQTIDVLDVNAVIAQIGQPVE